MVCGNLEEGVFCTDLAVGVALVSGPTSLLLVVVPAPAMTQQRPQDLQQTTCTHISTYRESRAWNYSRTDTFLGPNVLSVFHRTTSRETWSGTTSRKTGLELDIKNLRLFHKKILYLLNREIGTSL